MQPVPQRYEAPSSDKPSQARPRTGKTTKELLVEILSSVRFWGGLSVLVALVSLALPWWGITIAPSTTSSSWGLFFGSQSQPQPGNVVFFHDRLDAAFAASYTFMTTMLLLTGFITVIGAILKRRVILAISLILSVITALSFLSDVGGAVGNECNRTIINGGSCISGLVGQGTSGLDIVTWGFQAGFYTFIASTILLLGTLALQLSKTR